MAFYLFILNFKTCLPAYCSGVCQVYIKHVVLMLELQSVMYTMFCSTSVVPGAFVVEWKTFYNILVGRKSQWPSKQTDSGQTHRELYARCQFVCLLTLELVGVGFQLMKSKNKQWWLQEDLNEGEMLYKCLEISAARLNFHETISIITDSANFASISLISL